MTPDNAIRPDKAGIPHTVSSEPFDPHSVEQLSPEQERYFLASQWKMMWWRFLRHRLAVVSGIFLLLLYAAIFVCEFLAPYGTETRDHKAPYAPPQALHLFDQGQFIGPFVYGYDFKRNEITLKPEYAPNPAKVEKLRFFCPGEKYEFWGLFEGRLHLFCPAENATLHILGTDKLGHDLLSRLIYGARVSLTIGLFGVTLSFLLGIVIGGVAGYYGGWVDNLIQRLIEVLRSLPHLPLWLALAAILPKNWSALVVYFGITIILALLDWTGLARAVRSKLLSLREEEFCVAAQLMGARPSRIIGRHLLPSFMSHLIASATLSVPAMILGETSLSYLGLGLRRPIVSWGVLLNNAQDVDTVVLYPWLMAPAIPVILVVLAFNFFGDGLRDAADPYK
ncbi:MAG TPA: ABC transporter permease [Candidatus Angelobacter sp.]|nr:ABC transporter permease [Candidatus Angelobacter sp.]